MSDYEKEYANGLKDGLKKNANTRIIIGLSIALLLAVAAWAILGTTSGFHVGNFDRNNTTGKAYYSERNWRNPKSYQKNISESFSNGNFNNRYLNSDATRGPGMGRYNSDILNVSFDEYNIPTGQTYEKYKPVFVEPFCCGM